MASFCAAVGWVGYSRFSAIFVCAWFLVGYAFEVWRCAVGGAILSDICWILSDVFLISSLGIFILSLGISILSVVFGATSDLSLRFFRGARFFGVVVVLLSGSCFVFFFRGVNVCSMACCMARSISSGLFLSLIEIRQSRVLYSLLSFRSAASSWAVTIWRVNCQ